MTKETELKQVIKEYLELKRVFNFPILQGLASFKGIPDRIAVKNGRFYALEIKAPTGHLSKWQLEFKQKTEEAGGIYLEIRSLDELMKYF